MAYPRLRRRVRYLGFTVQKGICRWATGGCLLEGKKRGVKIVKKKSKKAARGRNLARVPIRRSDRASLGTSLQRGKGAVPKELLLCNWSNRRGLRKKPGCGIGGLQQNIDPRALGGEDTEMKETSLIREEQSRSEKRTNIYRLSIVNVSSQLRGGPPLLEVLLKSVSCPYNARGEVRERTKTDRLVKGRWRARSCAREGKKKGTKGDRTGSTGGIPPKLNPKK